MNQRSFWLGLILGALLVVVALLVIGYLNKPAPSARILPTTAPVASAAPRQPTAAPSQPTAGATPTPWLGHRTRSSGCKASGPMPDSRCTPGDIFSSATAEQICKPGYASSVRDVSSSVKRKVYESYGITSHKAGEYEVDHLVSLELGGSNSIANLWPEAANPRPGFHEKDRVENYLHDQVCDGKISLREAQRVIAQDWLSVYKKLPSR